MSIGFLLGKFAPLHKGHQLLIETALAENDHVIIMIYHSPEFTTVPLPFRANWIKHLYPSVQVIEAWDGPMEIGDTPEIKAIHEAYILKTLGSKTIDNFYSSEFYGEHVSNALGAKDRRIDSDRSTIPVSATAIRDDLFGNRQFIDPIVYRDLIIKAVLLGAPSTGKTTLAEHLAKQHHTVWMPEYGREYWDKHQCERRLTLEQLVEIAEGHREREDRLIHDANQVMFIDTDATTTYMFSMYYHRAVDQRLADMANDTLNRYDLFFLCETDIPYDDSWDRSGEANRVTMQAQIKADLTSRNIPFVSLSGNLQQRTTTVNRVLNQFAPHVSIADHLLNQSQIKKTLD